MKLQDKLNEMKEQSRQKLPPEAASLMRQTTEELAQSGILDGVAQVGATMPAFQLEDEHGNLLNSAHFIAKGPLVISFYRGVW
jgi:hypothetical protein